jgi:uncharacterized protein (TIGR03067 family)
MRRVLLVVLALSAVATVRAADDDPEPPSGGTAELRKLKGQWRVIRVRYKGRESAQSGATYVFDGDKVKIDAKGESYVSKLKVDVKKKPPLLEMTRQDRQDKKAVQRVVFKFDKGELYLATSQAKGNPKEDFSGNHGIVLVLTREKKKE